MTTQATARYMAADQRKAQILRAARQVLERDGIDRFSLEEVARQAGVAATLPRHYFESRDKLLAAALIDGVHEVTAVLIGPGPPLPERLREYARRLAQNQYGHELWLRSAHVHPDVDEVVQTIRRRMAEGSYRRRWADMAPSEQLASLGWIGYVESVVSQWLKNGAQDQEQLVAVLLEGGRRLGVRGA